MITAYNWVTPSVEQQTLAALERIEALLKSVVVVRAEPAPKPTVEHIQTGKKHR